MRNYVVYILASRSKVLYIGVSGNLEKRLGEHRDKVYPRSFAARYNCTRLVYLERYTEIIDAIARETQLKGWKREKKLALIDQVNPDWVDLTL